MIKKIIPKNKEEMVELLLEYKIAELNEIEGVSVKEIQEIENKYGKLPESYKDILLTIGINAGSLIDKSEIQFYYNDIIKLNIHIRELNQEAIELGEYVADLPDSLIFIEARYFGDAYFINTSGGLDSQVFQYFENDEKVVHVYESAWELVADLILSARMHIDIRSAITEKEKDNVKDGYRRAGFIG